MIQTVPMNDIEYPQSPPVPYDDDNHWDSCCLRIDKRAVLFFTQFFISLIIIFFCIYQLVVLPDCDTKTPFMGLLTLVVGVHLPAPTMGHKKE